MIALTTEQQPERTVSSQAETTAYTRTSRVPGDGSVAGFPRPKLQCRAGRLLPGSRRGPVAPGESVLRSDREGTQLPRRRVLPDDGETAVKSSRSAEITPALAPSTPRGVASARPA